ncbi:hypothetical protein [Gluconobacter sp. Gdi]|uniref:hypothetical protein n=1 Tax=Gluconobacter sp. Gdi TaxID=2691888 RepID=UPI0017785F0E|nr:hypothetical protein [Gluconobacter sp. Gdi]GFE97826.1 hypothetical protein DmGdi_28990 [Gluconobacter sp. Gdi]
MRIYIDRQIVIDHFNGEEIIGAVSKFREHGSVFPYSPAHIEEIAGAQHTKRGAETPASDKLKHQSQLSDNWAIMPSDSGPADFRIEDTEACFARVYKNEGFELTNLAIDFARLVVDNYQKPKKKLLNKVKKLNSNNILNNPEVLGAIFEQRDVNNFRVDDGSFLGRQNKISFLFDALNRLEFRKEHSAIRIKNRVHDVSHAIYASFSDIFVTNDKDLYHLAKAIFPFLNIKTEVITREEFIQRSMLIEDETNEKARS